MIRRGLAKCSSLFFIVLLMCPKLICSTGPVRKHKDRSHIFRSSKDATETDLKLGVNKYWTVIGQTADDDLGEVDSEPGFDLNDEEMAKFKLWPKGVVPYYIDVLSFNDKVLRDRIRLFLNTVNSLTRLNFLEMPSPPKDNETRWVFFLNRRGQLGCFDHSVLDFSNKGVQLVNLGYDCMSTDGELAEAVLSIAGVPAQHNCPDRDEYIKVIEENIMPEKKYLFQKLSDSDWLFHSVKYDFSSASHFHHHRYSENGQATIEFQDSQLSGTHMGDNHGFTKSDIKKLRMLYNYIVTKKENKVFECDRLFKKGDNYIKDLAGSQNPKPRPKPNRYLGLPEGELQQLAQEVDDHELEIKNEDDSKTETDIKKERKEEDVNSRFMKGLKFKIPNKRDPLTFLSDYETA